jgi:rhodanese-related sulfurtransferase
MRKYLFLLLLACPLACLAANQQGDVKTVTPKTSYHPMVGTIDMAGLKALIDSHADILIVDTNVNSWFTGKMIPGAVRLNADTSDEEILKAIPNKEKIIITYCGSYRCPASKAFAQQLIGLGYKNVMHYPGGIHEWRTSGNPIEQIEANPTKKE